MARLLEIRQTAPALGAGVFRSIATGGTNASSAQEAATSLQFISNTQINQPSGTPSLGIDAKIPTNYFPASLLDQTPPVVTGPLTATVGQTYTYTITNYVSTDTYAISPVSGTASQSGATITWTAPAGKGISGFIINGVNVIVNVLSSGLTITGPSSITEKTPVIYTIENYSTSIQYNVIAISGSVITNGALITYTPPATDGINILYSGFSVNETPVRIAVNPPPVPTVTGPVTLAIGQVGTYTITNYVPNGTYEVNALSGTPVVSGNTITYTAPSETGTYSLTINATMIAINVVLPSVMTPQIIAPVQGATDLGPNVTITSSPFAMTAGVDTQRSATWQLATDVNFLTVVQTSVADTVNLTSWTLYNLLSNATYYVRVLYTGINNEVSAYSPAVSFTTKASYIPSAITGEITGAAADNLGYAVAMDSLGLTLAVGAPAGDFINLYQYTNQAWTLFQNISAPSGALAFGISLSMNSLGNAFAVGAPNSQQVFIYQLQNNQWVQTAIFLSPTATGKFGYAVALNDSVNSLFIGDYESGLVYIYINTSGTWALSQTLTFTANSYYGYSLAINPAGTLLAVGAYLTNQVVLYQDGGQGFTLSQSINAPTGAAYFGVALSMSRESFTLLVGAGSSQTVYIYTSSTGAVWNLYQTLTSPYPSENGYYGRCLAINAQGNLLIVGASLSGNAYLYQLTSSQYTLAQLFTSSQTPNLGFSAAMTNDGTKAVVFDATAAIGLNLT